MKKLSLKNASTLLSRNEMKAISGGYAGGPDCKIVSDEILYSPEGQPVAIVCTWVCGDGYSWKGGCGVWG